MVKTLISIIAIGSMVGSVAMAQSGADQNADQVTDASADSAATANGQRQDGDNETPDANDADNAAASLNAQQKLQQSFTFTRKINGEIVDTETRTVTFDETTPLRETEAAASVIEQLKASFDRETLTRVEAYEEAKLDFTLADLDRDGAITSDEFVHLAGLWRDAAAQDNHAAGARVDRGADPTNGNTPHPNDESLNSADGQSIPLVETKLPSTVAKQSATEAARQKFLFMAGAAGDIDQTRYIREVMTDFDASDDDGDGVLRDDALTAFRASLAGFTVKM